MAWKLGKNIETVSRMIVVIVIFGWMILCKSGFLKKWMKQCQEAGRTPCQPSWPTPQAAACLKRGPTSLRISRPGVWVLTQQQQGWDWAGEHFNSVKLWKWIKKSSRCDRTKLDWNGQWSSICCLSKTRTNVLLPVWWPRPMSGFSRMDVVTCTPASRTERIRT